MLFPGPESCGTHGWVISMADPLDRLCRSWHVSIVDVEQRWQQYGAMRDACVDFPSLKQVLAYV